jgi:hypothetical protein
MLFVWAILNADLETKRFLGPFFLRMVFGLDFGKTFYINFLSYFKEGVKDALQDQLTLRDVDMPTCRSSELAWSEDW